MRPTTITITGAAAAIAMIVTGRTAIIVIATGRIATFTTVEKWIVVLRPRRPARRLHRRLLVLRLHPRLALHRCRSINRLRHQW
jgi:hypothetical protein